MKTNLVNLTNALARSSIVFPSDIHRSQTVDHRNNTNSNASK